MDSLDTSSREEIDGLAAFAMAAFVLALIVIAALERVGAPEAFVESLGPLFAALALCVIGLVARAPSVNDFLVARRQAPSGYSALAFAAVTAGLAIAMSTFRASPTPWLGAGAGVILSGLLIGPAVRSANVSSVSDWLATRFPLLPTRALFGAAGFGAALLTAIAGYQLAIDAVTVSIGASRPVAEAITLTALALSSIPGGLKSLLWTDAASGGAILLVILLGAAAAFWIVPQPLETLGLVFAKTLAAPSQSVGSLPFEAAVAAALASLAPLIAPGLTTYSPGQARLAGFGGLVLFSLGVVAAAIALPTFIQMPGGPPRSASALIATAFWLPSLAIARGGVFAVCRGLGLNLASGYAKLTVLASRRIALSRLAMLATIALCFVNSRKGWIAPGESLLFALALQLVGVAPLLALAFLKRASPIAGLVTAVSSFAASVAAEWLYHPRGAEMLIHAGKAGLAGFLVGALYAVFAPKRRRNLGLPADPFLDVPLDGAF